MANTKVLSPSVHPQRSSRQPSLAIQTRRRLLQPRPAASQAALVTTLRRHKDAIFKCSFMIWLADCAGHNACRSMFSLLLAALIDYNEICSHTQFSNFHVLDVGSCRSSICMLALTELHSLSSWTSWNDHVWKPDKLIQNSLGPV